MGSLCDHLPRNPPPSSDREKFTHFPAPPAAVAANAAADMIKAHTVTSATRCDHYSEQGGHRRGRRKRCFFLSGEKNFRKFLERFDLPGALKFFSYFFFSAAPRLRALQLASSWPRRA
jgi:hypothetical protein